MPGDALTKQGLDDAAAKALAAAQRLISQGDHEEAGTIIAAALAEIGDHRDLLAQLAWLRSQAGDRSGASEALLRLSAIVPLDAEQDAFIGFDYLATGRAAQAEPYLRAAVAAASNNPIFRTALVEALMHLARPKEALGVALPALRGETASVALWPIALTAAAMLKRHRLVSLLGRRAARRHPENPAILFAIARLLLDRGEGQAALDQLAALPDVEDAELRFLRSVALAQGKQFEEAFVEIERAIAIAPTERGYLLHAVAVLGQLGRHGKAAAFLDELTASRQDGAESEAWLRGVFATYTEAGRYDRAIEVGARIVQLAPADIGFLSVYETVINKHLYAQLISGRQTIAPSANRRERVPTRGHIRPPSFVRSVSALFRREMKTRFGRSRLGYLWVLFEPLAHIGIMIFLIGMLNHGGLPPIGQSFAVFYFTGIIPYHMFTHTAGHLIGSVPENRPLLQIPRVRILDIFAARAVLEAVTELIVAAIFLAAFVIVGLDAIPLEPLAVLGALMILWVAAIGVGMISAAIVSVFPAWERIWGAAASVIYFTSGTFYVPRMMPIWVRDILVWNPVLQGIELLRFHYFHEPAPEWLSVTYLVGFAVGTVAIALIMERLMRRRMLDVE
ncbi:ABC transporter permease [Sphingomonas sp. GB1N7]|uniref:ABC transporter permease n=1 Tax=Parasphingomonas caseinilytica TaxID=3096158 RepID=UPI002FC7FFEC